MKMRVATSHCACQAVGLVEWFLAVVLSALLAILCLFEKLGLPCVSICVVFCHFL